MPEFAALADKASETVTVTLDANLLGMAARFLSNEDPEQAKAKKLVQLPDRHLRAALHVRHRLRLSQGRHRWRAPAVECAGLEPHRRARSKKENTDVDVFVLIDGDKAQGLAIIASEPREFTIVNIVGNIDLEQLHDLEGNFGVPELEIETGKKPARSASTSPDPAKPSSQSFQRRLPHHRRRTEDQQKMAALP